MRPHRTLRLATLAAALVLSLPGLASAQATVGQPPFTPFKDTALLKPPAGHPVAIIEFEDLECPACAHAFPIVHAAIAKYKIPLLRHDFLIQGHAWSRQAAIMARYLEDKVSPETANKYRGDVFSSQYMIASPDDLQNFTRTWFAKEKLQMPFAVDPSGRFTAEVDADCTMGLRLGLIHTPTIVVLSPRGWTEVTDVTQLYSVIDNALAQVPTTTAVKGGPRKPATGTIQH
jgi:protein-disulfide isomerase